MRMNEFVVGDGVMLRVQSERFPARTWKKIHARRTGFIGSCEGLVPMLIS